MIVSLIERLGDWNWFVLGVLLLAVEIFAPGTFILWLGMAAIVTGVLALVTDWSWQSELIAFAVLSLIAVVGWWRFSARRRPRGAEPVLHRRAELHIGREFELTEPIAGGFGRMRIDDTLWRVSGPDLPAGTKVRVISVDGPILLVEPV